MLLGLSELQIIRLRKGVEEKGKKAVTHGNAGKSPSAAIKPDVKQNIINLYKTKYNGANYQHFIEMLEENEGIRISNNTAKRILNSEGIKSPKTKRKPKKHVRRKRHEHEGSMVQTDAKSHDFFSTGKNVCLHGATSFLA